ncbi:LemA family protein [Shewanella maritima]|uniref:LemA family protein n=1 Tax=Shewanella maritima TaxID=2520507 RepID=A0A411PF39_9GAMM|nr:LemA family protein [Shewanella maritima]QBF82022.1 LemA family protein [Shewanella maritima]
MILLIIAGVVLLGMWIIYNRIVKEHNSVQRGWADVLTQERQRGRIIPELDRVLQQHQDYEKQILPQITALRQGINALKDGEIDTKLQSQIDQQSQELIKGINVAVEAYPELRASESFSKFMYEITEQEENVGAAVRIFNQNVASFNSCIQVFPNNLVNGMFNKKQVIEVFSDSTASQSFEYKPKF